MVPLSNSFKLFLKIVAQLLESQFLSKKRQINPKDVLILSFLMLIVYLMRSYSQGRSLEIGQSKYLKKERTFEE